MRNQLFAVLFFTNYDILNEMCKSLSVRSVLKVEVDALTTIFLSDVDTFLLGVVLQNHLLKEEESSLVIDFLANLNT